MSVTGEPLEVSDTGTPLESGAVGGRTTLAQVQLDYDPQALGLIRSDPQTVRNQELWILQVQEALQVVGLLALKSLKALGSLGIQGTKGSLGISKVKS